MTDSRLIRALELKIPPVAVFLLFAAGMWGASKFFPVAAFALPFAAVFSAAFALLGAVTAVAGVIAFRRQRTTVNPMQPDAATMVVQTGVYRYTRNPMYLGLALGLLAWGLYLGNLVALGLIPAFVAYITVFQIRPEERAMLEKFGADYADHRAAVRRWL